MLHANGGYGDIYANNSQLQREIISMTCSIAKEAITNFYNQNFVASITMADLGCSSGSNTLMIVSNIIKQVEEIRQNKLHKKPLEYQIFLNDLHGNDFNAIFTSLPNFLEDLRTQIGGDFGLCFFNGVPGSFYARLFPSNTLHFFHSSSSLHWLSRGIVEEKMADSFNIPSYMPSPREVEAEVVNEGSFILNLLEVSRINLNINKTESCPMANTDGYDFAKCVQSVAEPLLIHHFGEAIVEELFCRYKKIVADCMAKEKVMECINLTISLTKIKSSKVTTTITMPCDESSKR